MNTHHVPQQAHEERSVSKEQFDESAFEAAFEQARADMELQGAETTPEIEQHLHDKNEVETTDGSRSELSMQNLQGD